MLVRVRFCKDEREIILFVAPVAQRRPAASPQHQPGIAQAEFMAIFDMDPLTAPQSVLRSIDREGHIVLHF